MAGIVWIAVSKGEVHGSLTRVAEHFEEALAFCRKAGYRPELAWSCYRYAEALLSRYNLYLPVGGRANGD